jgi:hypothetical protein
MSGNKIKKFTVFVFDFESYWMYQNTICELYSVLIGDNQVDFNGHFGLRRWKIYSHSLRRRKFLYFVENDKSHEIE